jgi:predicted nucleic acid-binding protein
MVDYLVGSTVGPDVGQRLDGAEVHVPAHFDAEVLSALGRLHRAGKLNGLEVDDRIDLLSSAPLQRHLLMPLLAGAWKLRQNLRLVDALYVELANQIEARIITTDAGLASASAKADLVGAG